MSACGGHQAGLAPRLRAAFTLIEVLISLAILAIALTVLAALIPAGAMAQRKTTRDIEALITANNSVAIYNGKRFSGLAMEYLASRNSMFSGPYPYLAAYTSSPMNGVNGGQSEYINFWSDFAFEWNGAKSQFVVWPMRDFDYIARDWYDNHNLDFVPSWFKSMSDTNGDGKIWTPGGDEMLNDDDKTDLAKGRLSVFHRRPYNMGNYYPPQDTSYPTSLDRLGDRRFFVATVFYDQNMSANNRDYWLSLFIMERGKSEGKWPEKDYSHYDAVNTPDPSALKDELGTGWMPDGGDTGDAKRCWRTTSAFTDGNDTPYVIRVPALTYSFNKNILRIAYPPSLWQKWGDRRLKPGDRFMAYEGGTVYTAVATANVGAADPGSGASAMQDVTVYPPLSATLLGPNTNPAAPAQKTWKVTRIWFAPPSDQGGPSSAAMIRKVHCDRAFSFSPND